MLDHMFCARSINVGGRFSSFLGAENRGTLACIARVGMYGHETTCGYASRALGDTMLALQNNGMKHSECTLRTMLFRMMLARIWHNMGGRRGSAR